MAHIGPATALSWWEQRTLEMSLTTNINCSQAIISAFSPRSPQNKETKHSFRNSPVDSPPHLCNYLVGLYFNPLGLSLHMVFMFIGGPFHKHAYCLARIVGPSFKYLSRGTSKSLKLGDDTKSDPPIQDEKCRLVISTTLTWLSGSNTLSSRSSRVLRPGSSDVPPARTIVFSI
jgi:hypothetical protein